MCLLKSNSLFDAMFPVLSLSSIVGITPFDIVVKTGQSKTLLSIPLMIVNISCMIIYMYCTISIVLLANVGFIYHHAKIFIYTEVSQIYASLLTMTAIHILKFFNRDNFANHFEIAEKLREIFHNLGRRRIYTNLKLKFYIASTLQIAFCAFLLGLNLTGAANLQPDERFPVIVVMVWPSYTIAIAQIITSSFVHSTKINIQILNEEICKIQSIPRIPTLSITSIQLYPKKRISLSLQTTNHEVIEKLDLIWKAYVNICKMSSNLNDYFCWLILAFLFLSFINTLFNVFYFLCILAYSTKLYAHLNIVYFIRATKCLVNAVNMFFLSVVVNTCETEASKKNN